MPTVSALFGVDASCERGKCCIRMCHMSYTRARAILHGRSTQHLLKLARIQASLLSRGCDPLATAPSSRVYRHASTISIVSDFQQESFTSRPPPWNDPHLMSADVASLLCKSSHFQTTHGQPLAFAARLAEKSRDT